MSITLESAKPQPASVRVLHVLHQAEKPMHWVEIEYATSLPGLRVRCAGLAKRGYLAMVRTGVYQATRKGLEAIGQAQSTASTKAAQRICNAAMREPYEPAKHNHMGRLGLARY